MRLIGLVENRLIRERSTAIPTHLSVLITLRFLAEGGLQKADDFIRFPGTEGQREHNSNRFQRTTRIPGIIGAVDGFMVTFYRPTINEEAFFNYRVGTSMNVQIIVDSDYNILNIRVCPGSNNDRFVWQFSEAKEYMEDLRADENFPNRYYIIGDSGYTPSRVLLTPDLNAAEGSPAHVYTLEHVRTRCIVERTIGILTNVWLVINRSRKLHYSPEAVVNIIHACAVLHNFRRRQGILDENDHNFQPAELRDDVNRRGRGEAAEYAAGIAERNHIIIQHFM